MVYVSMVYGRLNQLKMLLFSSELKKKHLVLLEESSELCIFFFFFFFSNTHFSVRFQLMSHMVGIH